MIVKRRLSENVSFSSVLEFPNLYDKSLASVKRDIVRIKIFSSLQYLVLHSMPRDQTLSGTVLPLLTRLHHMPQCEVTGAGFVCIYPLLTSCVSLGGPGPMHSFSEWERNSYRRIYNPICSLCHDVTIGKHPWFPHGMPLPIGHMLTPPTGKANSIPPTEGAT